MWSTLCWACTETACADVWRMIEWFIWVSEWETRDSQRMHEWINADVWINAWKKNEWMNERLSDWMNKWTNERTNERMNEWMNKHYDGVNVRTNDCWESRNIRTFNGLEMREVLLMLQGDNFENDAWMSRTGWMSEWMNERMSGWTNWCMAGWRSRMPSNVPLSDAIKEDLKSLFSKSNYWKCKEPEAIQSQKEDNKQAYKQADVWRPNWRKAPTNWNQRISKSKSLEFFHCCFLSLHGRSAEPQNWNINLGMNGCMDE